MEHKARADALAPAPLPDTSAAQAAGNALLSAGAGQAGKALDDYTLALTLLLWFGAQAGWRAGVSATDRAARCSDSTPPVLRSRMLRLVTPCREKDGRERRRAACVRAVVPGRPEFSALTLAFS